MSQGMLQSCPGTRHTQKQAFIQLQWLFYYRRFTHHYLFSTYPFSRLCESDAAPPELRLPTLSSLICLIGYLCVIFTSHRQFCIFTIHPSSLQDPYLRKLCIFPSCISHTPTQLPTSQSDMSYRKSSIRISSEGVSHLIVLCALLKCTADDRTYQKLKAVPQALKNEDWCLNVHRSYTAPHNMISACWTTQHNVAVDPQSTVP